MGNLERDGKVYEVWTKSCLFTRESQQCGVIVDAQPSASGVVRRDERSRRGYVLDNRSVRVGCRSARASASGWRFGGVKSRWLGTNSVRVP
jgi:hypothetical protein